MDPGVYLVRKTSEDHPVITLEFENLPQLRIALTNIPNHKYIVEMPAGATAADRVTLLDLRARGFDIAIRS